MDILVICWRRTLIIGLLRYFPYSDYDLIQRLLDTFATIKSMKVHRAAMWILGEYATSSDDIQCVMNQIRQTLGEVSRGGGSF